MANISIGIVGLPNVGKSTLFNVLTKQSVPAENYLFCTIDPSVGSELRKNGSCEFCERLKWEEMSRWLVTYRYSSFLQKTRILELIARGPFLRVVKYYYR